MLLLVGAILHPSLDQHKKPCWFFGRPGGAPKAQFTGQKALGGIRRSARLSGSTRSIAVVDTETLQGELYGETEMLLYGTDPLFQPFDSFLRLTVRELNERTSFPELIIQILTIIGMTPIEMHLEPFSH